MNEQMAAVPRGKTRPTKPLVSPANERPPQNNNGPRSPRCPFAAGARPSRETVSQRTKRVSVERNRPYKKGPGDVAKIRVARGAAEPPRSSRARKNVTATVAT